MCINNESDVIFFPIKCICTYESSNKVGENKVNCNENVHLCSNYEMFRVEIMSESNILSKIVLCS